MIKNIITKIIILLLSLFFLVTSNAYVAAIDTDSNIDSSFQSYINELNNYVQQNNININMDEIASNLKEGKGLEYDSILDYILTFFFKQIRITLSSAIIVLILIIISSLIKSLQISEKSDVMKLTNIVCFVSLCIVLSSTFLNMLELFKNTTNTLGNIMQIVSPFMLSLLIINGAITSIGIIQPLILFASSFITFLITNIILPLVVFSVIFGIIGNLNSNEGIIKLAKYFRKISLWILGIFLTIFLGILAMESSITKDVDSLAIKTTTSAVSNFIPVVGKFFSDSFETVVGASKIITKVSGIVGIIVVIIIVGVPVIKLISSFVIYTLVSILSEVLSADLKLVKIIEEFADVYKTLCGILIANSLMFIISVGIILNLSSSVVK